MAHKVSPEEFAESVEEIQKLTPMPGEFIVVRVKDANASQTKFLGIAQMLRQVFPGDTKVIIVDSKLELSTFFGKCLKCGTEISPAGLHHG